MPRDLSTDSTRLCSPLPSSVRSEQDRVDQRRDELLGRLRLTLGSQGGEERRHSSGP